MTASKPLLPTCYRLLAATFVIIGMIFFSRNPARVEAVYAAHVYPVIATVMQTVTGIFPFSLGDLLYVAAVVYLLVAMVLLFRHLFRREFRLAVFRLLRLVFYVQLAVIWFYLFWGMNYFRVPVATRFQLADSCCSTDDIRSVAALLIDSANARRDSLVDADFRVPDGLIFARAEQAVHRASAQAGAFPVYRPRVKRSLLGFFMNYLGAAGDFNPFTSEAQLNAGMPVFLHPFVACHEMAHQSGFNAEDEANYAGFVAGTASADPLLRYSSYYHGVQEFLYELRARDSMSFKALRERIHPRVLADFKTEREYWQHFEGQTGVLSALFYDHYLKLNNQPEGLKTYNRMVRLVIARYRKEGKLSPPGTTSR